jgi:antitoxin component of MazEF toxin-antitoxin module
MTLEISCKTKKWGSSMGIIIPKEIVEKERIHVGESIVVQITPRLKCKDLFGVLPKWKRSTEEIKKELKEGWIE